ncbi:MAG: SIS domain-containing protein [Candidatus Ranarchaeia archaeon]|jgi:6-phospho-3-hexuloisomerase
MTDLSNKESLISMANHAVEVADLISENELNQFISHIRNANRVYLVGVGKSGLIAKSFTMSLLSLDRDAYVVGESLMPTPDKNDLIIAVSGSGESDYTIKTVRLAKQLGTKVVIFTSQLESTLGTIGGENIHIPGRPKGVQETQTSRRLASGGHGRTKGALFEIGVFVFLNCVSTILAGEKEKTNP